MRKMKLLPIESCYQCTEMIDGECYHEKSPGCFNVSLIKTSFPEWCPLEDMKLEEKENS